MSLEPPLNHRTMTADDGEPIHYYVGGQSDPSAPVLVFLHGLGSNHTRWSRLTAQLFFRQSCRILVADLRGHGASHARRGVGEETISRDLCALLAHEGAERTVIIGHCWGANLAVRVWARCPERIDGLVLIEPFVVLALRWELRAAYAVARPVLWLIYAMMRGINALGIRRMRFRSVDYELYDEWVRSRLTSFWAAVRYMGPWVDLQTMPLVSYLQAFRMLFAYRPPWKSVACPVLAIYGRKAGLAESGGQQPIPPHGRTLLIEASHFVLTDNMPAVALAIETFVLERPSAGRKPGGVSS
jgi:pimeloyl-ACP methyl ester carboxylesterase